MGLTSSGRLFQHNSRAWWKPAYLFFAQIASDVHAFVLESDVAVELALGPTNLITVGTRGRLFHGVNLATPFRGICRGAEIFFILVVISILI